MNTITTSLRTTVAVTVERLCCDTNNTSRATITILGNVINDAITTHRVATVTTTAVGVIVVTRCTLVALFYIRVLETVTTLGGLTAAGTRASVYIVAITEVTGLARLRMTIATTLVLTC
jgi:hypothetical protein